MARTCSVHICSILYRSITDDYHSDAYRGREIIMKLITLYLPETYIKALDQLVNECFYPNRAEAIRVAIRDMISAEVWERKGLD